MSGEIVDQYEDIVVIREDNGQHFLRTEGGDPVEYDQAPRKVRFLLDQRELKRQGQLKLPLL